MMKRWTGLLLAGLLLLSGMQARAAATLTLSAITLGADGKTITSTEGE
jgi:hypothetical protein